jgi:hypothetical protein
MSGGGHHQQCRRAQSTDHRILKPQREQLDEDGNNPRVYRRFPYPVAVIRAISQDALDTGDDMVRDNAHGSGVCTT